MQAKHFAFLALGLFATGVAAHTELSSSVPAEQAVVASTPEQLVLTFSTDVRITALTLTDAASVSYDLGALPTTAQREFSIPVPVLGSGAGGMVAGERETGREGFGALRAETPGEAEAPVAPGATGDGAHRSGIMQRKSRLSTVRPKHA